MNNPPQPDDLFEEISQLVERARNEVQRSVNSAMVQTYWHIGRLILEREQQGERRAAYGKAQLKRLSERLTKRFGKGFDATNLRNMRRFYQAFPIRETLSLELSWSHYNTLSRLETPQARIWYMEEAANQGWSVRALERQIGVLYYERLISSKEKAPVEAEARDKTTPLTDDPRNYLRDPYILDFLNLDSRPYQENHLEQGIINNLQRFLLELGSGFAFVERQQRIRTDDGDYYVDLVFYNYFLKCFVLIDLKMNRLTHQDVGQMDMYVRLYEEQKRGQDDNPTIGLILCSEHNHTVAKYSVLKDSQQLFASKYVTVLPSEEELKRELERERERVQQRIEESAGQYRVDA
ncbi:PDDEXK nuclease domain-containing protein [Microbulbifer halophilus]|uniref:YhcG family protein n=1 Tax=Microbulbifer halophilus TaxID=453963 RepID=A0ABW5EEU7_9GAMM|nr:PDDEXK nuclease domain-containing protein [Microbulbifer halophilus]MCW8127873.1 PDDEXK nuclease domain-containing protein [Microbulbifer halophilus]